MVLPVNLPEPHPIIMILGNILFLAERVTICVIQLIVFHFMIVAVTNAVLLI
jgi:hypothetical protein